MMSNRNSPHGLAKVVLIGVFGLGVNANAQVAPIVTFSNCYSKITQLPLPLNHDLRAQVQNLTLSATDACMTVLERAILSRATQGGSALPLNPTAEQLAVLRTFQHLHFSWFTAKDYRRLGPVAENRSASDLMTDIQAPALYYTAALFSLNTPFSSIFSGTTQYQALRSGGFAPMTFTPPTVPQTEPSPFPMMAQSQTARSTRVRIDFPEGGRSVGDLIGLRPHALASETIWTESSMSTNLTGLPSAAVTTLNNTKVPLPYRSFGGGVLGSSVFLQANLGRNNLDRSNGGNIMNRRAMMEALKTFACRDFPSLRPSDVRDFVATTPTVNTPSFRQASQCMSCHVTMDGGAGALRNFHYIRSANGPAQMNNEAFLVGEAPVVMPRNPNYLTVENDPHFSLREPKGILMYRSFDGSMIRREVIGVEQLGQALADTNDPYVCAAKRYYEYFTGISVSLADPGAEPAPEWSADEWRVRNEVIELGLRLKQSQSLRQLIEEILAGPEFMDSSLRLKEIVGGAY